jgi:hypothetical protein
MGVKMIQLIGGFIFVCALVIFWHFIAEVRDLWRSTREMERLEKEIDAENANAERHAHYQDLLEMSQSAEADALGSGFINGRGSAAAHRDRATIAPSELPTVQEAARPAGKGWQIAPPPLPP